MDIPLHTGRVEKFRKFSSVAQSCPTLCSPMDCSMPCLSVHHQHLELAQTHVHRVGDAIQIILSSINPFSSCLQSFPASGFFPISQFFSSGGQSIGASTSASILPMVSLRMDWLDLLAVQGTLKSLLQLHSSKALILWHSAFFTYFYMTDGLNTGVRRTESQT